jgi:hypothetical protein
MGLLFIYVLIGIFFGFNFMLDYSNDQRKNGIHGVFILLASILIIFPIGFVFWPLIVMRVLYKSITKKYV